MVVILTPVSSVMPPVPFHIYSTLESCPPPWGMRSLHSECLAQGQVARCGGVGAQLEFLRVQAQGCCPSCLSCLYSKIGRCQPPGRVSRAGRVHRVKRHGVKQDPGGWHSS